MDKKGWSSGWPFFMGGGLGLSLFMGCVIKIKKGIKQ